jgi:preprotein translocase subunit SecF
MRIFHNPNYNFIKWRWHALIFSVVIIWGGVGAMYFSGGLPMGIEFTGGTALNIKFAEPTTEDAVRSAMDPVSQDKVVQRFGDPAENRIVVRLPLQTAQEEGASIEADASRAREALTAANLKPLEITTEIVGPQVGGDLQRKGIWATLTALGGILIYVAFRFRLTFAVGAIIATFHDILITLVALWFFNYDLSLNVIAAILTIAGYSVNDTIVVFDRVREDQRTMRKEPLDVIVNKAVNHTLARTIITSGTTFLAVLALFLFGGEVLKSFAFTMLVGIVTGAYSTVFIAASIAIILSRRPSGPAGATAKARAARA